MLQNCYNNFEAYLEHVTRPLIVTFFTQPVDTYIVVDAWKMRTINPLREMLSYIDLVIVITIFC